jgi:NitT/TauT family transport system permease protein
MRYATHLRTSRRHHILKKPVTSSLIALMAFSLIITVFVFVFKFTPLNPTRFIDGILISLVRTSIAYLVSLVIALLLAFLITANRHAEAILLPIFDVLQSFPSFALFPVLVGALNNSPEVVIIAVMVITMVWPILFSIITGLKNRREDLEEAAKIFGATGTKKLLAFTLPELFPAIVTGSIVGWGEGWEFIIGAELLVHAQQGIGSYLGELGQNGGLLALGIALLMLFLFVINRLIWLPLLHQSTRYQVES